MVVCFLLTPLVKSRKPAFHSPQEGLLLRRRQKLWPVVPIKCWVGLYVQALSLDPSSLFPYFWIHSSFEGQNCGLFPTSTFLGGGWACGCLGGGFWRPGLCLNRTSLITSIHPLQNPGRQ